MLPTSLHASEHRRARTTVLVPSRAALNHLVASGTVFRIEPVQPLVTATEWSQPVAAAGEYADWDKPREPGEVF